MILDIKFGFPPSVLVGMLLLRGVVAINCCSPMQTPINASGDVLTRPYGKVQAQGNTTPPNASTITCNIAAATSAAGVSQ